MSDSSLSGPASRWHAICSTEYVRGREAGEVVVPSVVGIAKRNGSFILHEEGL